MASRAFDKITELWRRGVCMRLLLINVSLFLLYTLFALVCLLFDLPWADAAAEWVELPASLSLLLTRPWTLVSYMFFHRDLLHLLFNMLWLYWFGQIFLYSFSSRHFAGLYLLGGLAGGLFYVAAYNLFPLFAQVRAGSWLLGASASVLAVAVAAAVRNPNFPVRLFLFGTIKFKYIVLAAVLLSFLFIGSSNSGGNIAHIGGAAAGWLFVWALDRGCDLTAWINAALDFVRLPLRRNKKPRMRVHRTTAAPGGDRAQDYEYNRRKRTREQEIDAILEKLRKSGYESLSEQEKKILFNAGQK